MNVLITGAAGYIGSHAALALRDAGLAVVAVDSLERGHRDALPADIPFVEADIGERSRMRRLFEEYAVDAVMHFAAYAYVGESVDRPALYYRNNTAAFLNLLLEASAAGVKQFIFSSTCAVYGSPEQMPIDETFALNPINPYGASKQMAERILQDAARTAGMRPVIFRYFNAAGADPHLRAGERHDPETHLIPLALETAAGKRPCLDIFGDDFPTPDGTCIRDYIHVCDVVDAHVRALDFSGDGEAPAVFNLSTGRGASVREVIAAVERVTGRPVTCRTAPCRAGDPPVLVGCADRARRALGWRPRFSALDTIVQHAWNWQRQSNDEARSTP